MTRSLSGKRIVLTGTSRGVGLATARLLLAEGAEVLGVARDPERLARTTRELVELHGARYSSVALDLADRGTPERLAAVVAERFSALDAVVHNAGVMLSHEPSITAEPDALLEATMDLNVFAPLRVSRALVPLLLRGNEPRLVNVSSGAGTHHGLTEPKIAAYRLSKWTLNGLTLLQAREFTGKIAVNALDPGWVKTDLGGPEAPGVPEESARGLLEVLRLPFETTGRFWKNGEEIPW